MNVGFVSVQIHLSYLQSRNRPSVINSCSPHHHPAKKRLFCSMWEFPSEVGEKNVGSALGFWNGMADDDSCCRYDPCLILECSRMVVKFNLSHTVGDIRNHIVAYPLMPQCICACLCVHVHVYACLCDGVASPFFSCTKWNLYTISGA